MIIACDVDDTVAPSCQVINKNAAIEIYKQMHHGTTFVFISGSTCDEIFRQVSSGLKIFSNVKTYHILGTSGNSYDVVVDNNDRTEVYRKNLDDETAMNIQFLFNELCKKYRIRSLTSTSDQIQDRGSQITFSALGRHAPSEQKASLDPTGEKRKEWIEYIRKVADEYSISLYKLDISIGGTTSIDVTYKGSDKAGGISNWLLLNKWARQEDIVFYGDKLEPGGNDYSVRKIIDKCISVTDPDDFAKKISQ